MRHYPSPTLQPPSSRPLERWPASGEARVNLWAVLIGGAARPPDAATPSQVDEATEPGSRDALRSPRPGQGTVCTHMQPRRLPRVIRTAIKTRLALSYVLRVRYTQRRILEVGLDRSRVSLTRPSAPPGGPGRKFSPPQKTWGGQGLGREAMLTWLGRAEHPARPSTLPLRLRRARGGLTVRWRP